MPFTVHKVSVGAEHVAVTYTNSNGSAIQLHATTNRTTSTTLAVAEHFKLITHPKRKGVVATNYNNNNNEVIVPASDEINTDDDIIIPSLTLSSSSSLAPISILSSTFNDSSSTASTITTTTITTTAPNVTQESSEVPEIPAYIRTTAMFFCIVIMLMGVIGNVMVPIVIIRTKDMRNSTNIFLTNLSIADILVLLVCTPTVLVELNTRPETWVLGHEMCKAVPFIELTVAHASVLTILAISFERYYAICEPLKAGYVCTKTRAILICSLAWAIAALFTSPILWVAEYKYVDYIDGSSVPVCLTQALTIWTMGFFVMTVTVFFILPLFILIVLYGIIAKNLISNNGPMMRIRPTKPELSLKARKQVVLMLGAVVLAFFLCLLPFHLFTMWIVLDADHTILDIGVERYYSLLYFCRIMWYLNSAINPVLYNLMSTKFRKGFYKLIYSVWLAVISWLSCGRCGAWRKRSGTNAVTATTTTSSNTNTTTNTSSSILSRSSNRRSSDEICTRTRVQIQMQIPHGSDCEMVAMLHNNSTAVVAASMPALNRHARAGGRAAVIKSHPQRRLSSSPTSPANQQHSQQQNSVKHRQQQPQHHPDTHEHHHHHHHHVVCSRFKTKQISFEEEAALA